MTTSTKTSIDRTTHTITFSRTFDVSCADVFAAWTDPAQVTKWWDPTGTPLADCSIDLRPGGKFCFTMGSHHGHAFAGVYRSIERPSTIVFDAMGSEGTVHLTSNEGKTQMAVTIRCASSEHLDQFLKLGVDKGTEGTLDNLVTHLKR